MISVEIDNFAKQLWLIDRSITRQGAKTTLDLLNQHWLFQSIVLTKII